MEYGKKQISGLRVAYIGGGSRGWAWGFMADLAMDYGMEGEMRMYDIDRDAAEKNQSIGQMASEHPEAVSHCEIQRGRQPERSLDRRRFCGHLNSAWHPG